MKGLEKKWSLSEAEVIFLVHNFENQISFKTNA